jgi:hypothetical protein
VSTAEELSARRARVRIVVYLEIAFTGQQDFIFVRYSAASVQRYKIFGFHGVDCEECRLMRCDVAWLL